MISEADQSLQPTGSPNQHKVGRSPATLTCRAASSNHGDECALAIQISQLPPIRITSNLLYRMYVWSNACSRCGEWRVWTDKILQIIPRMLLQVGGCISNHHPRYSICEPKFHNTHRSELILMENMESMYGLIPCLGKVKR